MSTKKNRERWLTKKNWRRYLAKTKFRGGLMDDDSQRYSGGHKHGAIDNISQRYFIMNEAPTNVERRTIFAPQKFCLLENRDETIDIFKEITEAAKAKDFVTLDLVNVAQTDFITINYLTAFMRMRFSQHNIGYYLDLRGPKRWDLKEQFTKYGFTEVLSGSGETQTAKFVRKIGEKYEDEDEAKIRDILRSVQKFMEYSRAEMKFLTDMLGEIINNSTKHSSDGNGHIATRWYINKRDISRYGQIELCLIDLGVGIHESILNKGTENFGEKNLIRKTIDMFKTAPQGDALSKIIPVGGETTTGDPNRGQGLKSLFEDATTTACVKGFKLLTNRAYVDFLNINEKNADSTSNLQGTVYLIQIERQKNGK